MVAKRDLLSLWVSTTEVDSITVSILQVEKPRHTKSNVFLPSDRKAQTG